MGDTRVKGGQQVEDGGQQGGGTGLKVGDSKVEVGGQQGGGTARWRDSKVEGRRQQGGGTAVRKGKVWEWETTGWG